MSPWGRLNHFSNNNKREYVFIRFLPPAILGFTLPEAMHRNLYFHLFNIPFQTCQYFIGRDEFIFRILEHVK